MFGFWKPNIRASLPGTGRRLGLQERRSGRAGALPPRRASGLALVWFTVPRLRKGGNREPCSWLGKPWGKPGKRQAPRRRRLTRVPRTALGRTSVGRTVFSLAGARWRAPSPGAQTRRGQHAQATETPWARRQLRIFLFHKRSRPQTKDKEKEQGTALEEG